MDIPSDEIRRQLRAIRSEHDQAHRIAPTALRQLADPDLGVAPAAKDATLGTPSRRQLLRLGGISVLGASVLAACTPAPEDIQVAQSGVRGTTTTSQLTAQERVAQDLERLRVAQSIEALAVTTYDEVAPAISRGLFAETIELFADQHRDHATALSETIQDLGGEPYQQGSVPWDRPNPALVEALAEPRSLATDDVGILTLAIVLENVAQQTYTYDVRLLSTPELRAFAMSIGGVEARHASVLFGFESPGMPTAQAPFPFGRTLDAVKDGDAVEVVGSGTAP